MPDDQREIEALKERIRTWAAKCRENYQELLAGDLTPEQRIVCLEGIETIDSIAALDCPASVLATRFLGMCGKFEEAFDDLLPPPPPLN